MEPDRPIDFGVTEFCGICRKCARDCPGQAISYGERTYENPDANPEFPIKSNQGALKWYVNAMKCIPMWVKAAGACVNCHTASPFNKPNIWPHRFARWLVKNAPIFDSLLLKLDDALGYGKVKDPREADEWWHSKAVDKLG